jgi:hypothetical protein
MFQFVVNAYGQAFFRVGVLTIFAQNFQRQNSIFAAQLNFSKSSKIKLL